MPLKLGTPQEIKSSFSETFHHPFRQGKAMCQTNELLLLSQSSLWINCPTPHTQLPEPHWWPLSPSQPTLSASGRLSWKMHLQSTHFVSSAITACTTTSWSAPDPGSNLPKPRLDHITLFPKLFKGFPLSARGNSNSLLGSRPVLPNRNTTERMEMSQWNPLYN
jgi:hypothetical protein